MTAKIKLNTASGGGSFSLQAPSSSSNNRVMTLPDTADGTVLTTTNPKSGNVTQVVQDTLTSTASFGINNTIYVPNAPSATLTPASSSNKILVDVYLNTTLNDANAFSQLILYREIGGSGGFSAVTGAIGDAAVSRRRVTAGFRSTGSNGFGTYQVNIKYLDSPNTTSSVQYKVAHCHAYQGYTEHFINRTATDTDNSAIGRMYSSMILQEIAG
tara:strand:- start:230 stop:871 length:642 start_codon:yes stop_codon:yes gene_type:complete